jgi:nucleotide-binding universal stress UspA family protein
MTAQMIVVPLDGSRFAERAIPVARTIAHRVGAGLALVTTDWDGRSEASIAYLEGVAAGIDDVPTEATVVDAPPTIAIERVVDAGPDRIVCMTSHGRGKIRWAVMGSVAEDVLRNSVEPVVVVGRHCEPGWPPGISYVLVCVDGSTPDDPVVPVATRWAKALGLGVRVASVIHPLDIEGATTPNPVVEAITEQFASAGVDAATVNPRGWYVTGTIADLAHSLPAALIVMNTHGRTGRARMTLGSVAMGTVGLAPCPVLVVPPAGS